MHRLTRLQSRRAELLAETLTARELGVQAAAATGKALEVLAWAIYLRSTQDRVDAGNPVPTAGYSGRQTNRHR